MALVGGGGVYGQTEPPGVEEPAAPLTEAAPAGGSAAPADADGGWGLAPIGWGGQIGLRYRTIRSDDGTTTDDFYQSLQTRAASYIYAPWFAQVSANLHLAHNTTDTSVQGESTTSDANLVSGDANLHLFPVSRFPLSAYVNASDSRTEAVSVDQDYRSLRYGARQSYRPPTGPQYYNLGYDESIVTTTSIGRDVVRSVSGGGGTSGAAYTLGINGSAATNERDDGRRSRFSNLRANHGWRPQTNMSVDTFADLSQSETETTDPVGTTFDNRFTQLGSNVSWRPHNVEIPLTLHGGVRAFELASADAATRGMTANANANYAYNRNLSLNANTLVSRIEPSDGEGTTTTLLGAGAGYRGDPRMFGQYAYTWGTRANVSTVTSGVDSGLTTIGAGADHGVSRRWPIGIGDAFSVSLSQAINQTASDGASGDTTNLTHTATGSYSITRAAGFHGGVTLQATDLLTRGDTESHYQAVSLRLDGSGEIDRHSSINANLSLLWSRQDSDDLLGAQQEPRVDVHGSLLYNHRQALGVRNLIYTLRFTARDAYIDRRELGDVTALPFQATYLLENRLTYRLGLFAAHLDVNWGETSGREFTSTMIWLTRDFGSN
jgi:hypothetical protein